MFEVEVVIELFRLHQAIYIYLQFFKIISYLLILTHPVNFLCGRKPENPEKTHDKSVDKLFPHAIRCLIPGFDP